MSTPAPLLLWASHCPDGLGSFHPLHMTPSSQTGSPRTAPGLGKSLLWALMPVTCLFVTESFQRGEGAGVSPQAEPQHPASHPQWAPGLSHICALQIGLAPTLPQSPPLPTVSHLATLPAPRCSSEARASPTPVLAHVPVIPTLVAASSLSLSFQGCSLHPTPTPPVDCLQCHPSPYAHHVSASITTSEDAHRAPAPGEGPDHPPTLRPTSGSSTLAPCGTL